MERWRLKFVSESRFEVFGRLTDRLSPQTRSSCAYARRLLFLLQSLQNKEDVSCYYSSNKCKCLRRIMGTLFTDRITNEEELRRSGMTTLHEDISRGRLRLSGHRLRMQRHRLPRISIQWIPPSGERTRGRPRNARRRTFMNYEDYEYF